MTSRGGLVVVMVLLLLGATACEPWPVPYGRSRAELDITLEAGGSTSAELFLGGRIRSRDEVRRVGTPVCRAIEPTSQPSVTVDGNGGGYPFVRCRIDGGFTPGRRPVARVHLQPAVSALGAAGYTSVRLSVQAPDVASSAVWSVAPAEADNGWWSWDLRSSDEIPAGSITLRPEPGSALRSLGTTDAVLTLLLAAAILLGVRRRATAGATIAVLAAGAAGLLFGTTAAGVDDIEAVGRLSHSQGLGWIVVRVLLVVVAASGGIASVVLLRAASRARQPLQFNPPPGWPTPPVGWLPAPGWQPDPAWPHAPPGWAFFGRPPRRRKTPPTGGR